MKRLYKNFKTFLPYIFASGQDRSPGEIQRSNAQVLPILWGYRQIFFPSGSRNTKFRKNQEGVYLSLGTFLVLASVTFFPRLHVTLRGKGGLILPQSGTQDRLCCLQVQCTL